jgi:hypothetical protein
MPILLAECEQLRLTLAARPSALIPVLTFTDVTSPITVAPYVNISVTSNQAKVHTLGTSPKCNGSFNIFSPYHAVNTLSLRYKNQSVNTV